TGFASNDQLGTSVASAGDMNGDGFADIIVGAPLSDVGGVDAGRAYVFFGGRSPDAVADITMTGAAAGDQLGYFVAPAGDVNGDGFADAIAGAPFSDQGATVDIGRAYVFYGGPTADGVADFTMIGAAAGDNFGNAVAPAGDVNADGFSDVIVGADNNDAGG